MAFFRLEEIETYSNKIKMNSQEFRQPHCDSAQRSGPKSLHLGARRPLSAATPFTWNYPHHWLLLHMTQRGFLWILLQIYNPAFQLKYFRISSSPSNLQLPSFSEDDPILLPRKTETIRHKVPHLSSHKLIPSFIQAILFATLFPSTFLFLSPCY